MVFSDSVSLPSIIAVWPGSMPAVGPVPPRVRYSPVLDLGAHRSVFSHISWAPDVSCSLVKGFEIPRAEMREGWWRDAQGTDLRSGTSGST